MGLREGQKLWKFKALEIIPPRLVLGAYRDVIGTINGLELIFSTKEIIKEITGGLEGIDHLNPLAIDRDRCVRILPTILSHLSEAGLLSRRDDGRFKKSQDFQDFWDLTKKVRTNAEKAIRWGIYYTISGEKNKSSLSSDELIDALTPPSSEVVDILDRLAVLRKGKWKRILTRRDSDWLIRDKLARRPAPPSVIKDVAQKALYTLSLFSDSGDTQVTTSKITEKVRSLDLESIEKFLLRLHFKKHDSHWLLPIDIVKTPQQLIDRIEMLGRLPARRADYECLRFLDSAHLSATEIVGLTGIDKSTISRALKRLSDKDFIRLTGKKGRFGEIYYTTFCENCWQGKDKEECKDEMIADIERVLKSHEFRLVKIDWNAFSNQALNQLAQHLAGLEVEKLTKLDVKEWRELWNTLLKPRLTEMMDALETRAVRMADKKGWIDDEQIYELIDEKGKTLPHLYFLGIRHTLESEQVREGLKRYLGEISRESS